MNLRFMNQTVKILAILLLVGILLFDTKAVAMAKNIYFVDVDAPQTTVKGQPYNSKVIEDDFYKIEISYPADHRVKLPLRQMCGISIHGKPTENINFKILRWEILDTEGEKFVPVFRRALKDISVNDVIGKEISTSYASFDSFYSIPSSVKLITIHLEIELTSPEGKKVLVKESIPLKQATFKTSFFEGWNW